MKYFYTMVEYIFNYFEEFADLLFEMSPWLLLGFLFAGLLHIFIPKDKVRKLMGRKNLKSVLYATLLGIPLPLCSCGVIPTGISFYKEGASKGATVSFLISTPQTGVDSILATYALMGWPFAIIRPVVAFFSGLFGGWITNFSKDDSTAPTVEPTIDKRDEIIGFGNKIRTMFRYAFVDFLMDIAKWLIIGLAIAALIALLLPDDFFTSYIQNEILSMLLVLVASIPLYVCATGSIPIAAVLMMKGLSPGAALVFLMAGPATNAATMAVIGKAIDRKTLMSYMASIIFSALIFGFIINQFLPREWFTYFISDHAMHNHEVLPLWLKISSGIILSGLIIYGYAEKIYKKHLNKSQPIQADMGQLKFKVTGMTCSHCKANVENGVKSIPGITNAIANPDTDELLVDGEGFSSEDIQNKVEDLGYGYSGKLK